MKSILGTILIGLSPFIAAIAFLGILRAMDWYAKRRYQKTIDRRNARQELYGIKPFRGTKEWQR
jgi:hypothetical protein